MSRSSKVKGIISRCCWCYGTDVPSIVIHKTWTPTAGDLVVSALDALGLVPSTSLQSAVESNETFSGTKQEIVGIKEV